MTESNNNGESCIFGNSNNRFSSFSPLTTLESAKNDIENNRSSNREQVYPYLSMSPAGGKLLRGPTFSSSILSSNAVISNASTGLNRDCWSPLFVDGLEKDLPPYRTQEDLINEIDYDEFQNRRNEIEPQELYHYFNNENNKNSKKLFGTRERIFNNDTISNGNYKVNDSLSQFQDDFNSRNFSTSTSKVSNNHGLVPIFLGEENNNSSNTVFKKGNGLISNHEVSKPIVLSNRNDKTNKKSQIENNSNYIPKPSKPRFLSKNLNRSKDEEQDKIIERFQNESTEYLKYIAVIIFQFLVIILTLFYYILKFAKDKIVSTINNHQSESQHTQTEEYAEQEMKRENNIAGLISNSRLLSPFPIDTKSSSPSSNSLKRRLLLKKPKFDLLEASPIDSTPMSIDTPLNNKRKTNLAFMQNRNSFISHSNDDAEESFIVNPLRWNNDGDYNDGDDNGKVKNLNPNTLKEDDYGTHFYFDEVRKEDKNSTPNIESDHYRKVFNKDDKFKIRIQETDQNLVKNQNDYNDRNNEKRTSSISDLFAATDRFRKAFNNGVEPQIINEKRYSQEYAFGYLSSKYSSPTTLMGEHLLGDEEFLTYKSIIQEKRRRQELIKEQRLKDQAKVKPLSHDEQAVVINYLKSTDLNRIVKDDLFGVSIRVRDLKTLENGRWLNDNIIDCYLSLISERSKNNLKLPKVFSFTTHFYTTLSEKGYQSVARWAKRKKVEVTKLDYIFVPINTMNSHWSLAVINNKEKKFQYYNSLSYFGSEDDSDEVQKAYQYSGGLKILEKLSSYMSNEHKRLNNGYSDVDYAKDYTFYPLIKCPQQQNGSDCGVFTCTFVEYLSRDMGLNFSQSDMPNLRRRMCYEILSEALINH